MTGGRGACVTGLVELGIQRGTIGGLSRLGEMSLIFIRSVAA
jgi:hypothetical protein